MSDRIVVMNEGRVEQEGMPLDIYDCPRTRFVAGFLGMENLLPVSIVQRTGDHAVVRLAEGSELIVPLHGDQQGDWATLAFRAECVSLGRREGAGGGPEAGRASTSLSVAGTLEFVTNLGARVICEVRLRDGKIVCAEAQRTDRSREFTVGEPLTVTLQGDRCVLLVEEGAGS